METLAWGVAGFLGVTLLNLVAWFLVFFLGRQGRGEAKQSIQGETLATLSARVTGIADSREKEVNVLRSELVSGLAAADRRATDIEARVERQFSSIDTRFNKKSQEIDDLRQILARTETIVENLAKQVERLIQREERERERANPDSTLDMATVRALSLLLKGGFNNGQTTGAGA